MLLVANPFEKAYVAGSKGCTLRSSGNLDQTRSSLLSNLNSTMKAYCTQHGQQVEFEAQDHVRRELAVPPETPNSILHAQPGARPCAAGARGDVEGSSGMPRTSHSPYQTCLCLQGFTADTTHVFASPMPTSVQAGNRASISHAH